MKAGDRVKVVRSIYKADELQPGATGRIVEKGFTYNGFEVRMDSGYADDTGDDLWPFDPHELEVIQ